MASNQVAIIELGIEDTKIDNDYHVYALADYQDVKARVEAKINENSIYTTVTDPAELKFCKKEKATLNKLSKEIDKYRTTMKKYLTTMFELQLKSLSDLVDVASNEHKKTVDLFTKKEEEQEQQPKAEETNSNDRITIVSKDPTVLLQVKALALSLGAEILE